MFKRKKPKEEEKIPEGKKKVTCPACRQDMIIEKKLTILECFGNGAQHSFTDNPKFIGLDVVPRKIEDWEENQD